MTRQQEYHKGMKRWITPAVAAFGALFFLAPATSYSHAQSGVGHASASSSAPASHPTAATSTRPAPARPTHNATPGGQVHRYLYGGVYVVGAPASSGSDAAADPGDDANYQGGPTIFDRRGSGSQSYIPSVPNAPVPHPHQETASNSPQPESESEADPTMLIFKDGHRVEVGNYAIVGHNLYDMSPGHSQKVALADLDITATQKQNQQHGVKFQVPASALAE